MALTNGPVLINYENEPNDTYFENQWNLDAIQALEAWGFTTGDASVKIGITDRGTQQDHEDLVGKIDGGDGIEDSHGTRVAGVAGAATNNDLGISSLGWNTHLYTYGHNSPTSIANNIVLASQNCDIINMSFITVRYATENDMENMLYCSNPLEWVGSLIPHSYPEVEQAVSNAVTQGIHCIASAGNKSGNIGHADPYDPDCDHMAVPYPAYPASYDGVLAIGGTMLANGIEQINDEWNYGDFVDFSAPGMNILTIQIRMGDILSIMGRHFLRRWYPHW